jgi:hypothetical protein
VRNAGYLTLWTACLRGNVGSGRCRLAVAIIRRRLSSGGSSLTTVGATRSPGGCCPWMPELARSPAYPGCTRPITRHIRGSPPWRSDRLGTVGLQEAIHGRLGLDLDRPI